MRMKAPLPAAAESQQANKYESKQRDEDVTFKIWYANVRLWPTSQEVALSAPTQEISRGEILVNPLV